MPIGHWDVRQLERRGDHIYAEVWFWEKRADFNRGLDPFLMNDFKVYRPTQWDENTYDGLGRVLCDDGNYYTWEELLNLPQRQIIKVLKQVDDAREHLSVLESYIERANRLNYSGDHRGTTLNVKVNNGTDDAHETDFPHDFNRTATIVAMNSNGSSVSRYNGGFVFDNVTIPNAATINSATLSTWASGTFYDDPCVNIYGNDVDNANSFSAEGTVTNRTLTTANVSYQTTGIGTGKVASSDIASVVQEIVNRASWASGNSMGILPRGKTSPSQNWWVQSYEGDSTKAAELDVDYTAGGGPAGPNMLTLLGVG